MEPRQDATTPIDPANTVRDVLRAHGLDVADFEFEEHESCFVELLGSSGTILAVRRRCTGEERLYAISRDSAWLGAFVIDLASGHFGKVGRQTA